MHLFILALTGACLGSFTSLVAVRIPRGESIIAPRSHCDYCQTNLTLPDLIPIVSYCVLRGRCRTCRIKIDRNHFNIELLFMAVMMLGGTPLPKLIWGFMMLLAVLSAFDIHWLAVPTLGIGCALVISTGYAFFVGTAWSQILFLFISYLAVQWLNAKWLHIGAGDIDIAFIMQMTISAHQGIIVILIATGCALVAHLITRRQRLPFIPFLTIGYCTVWLIPLWQ